jgi:cell wall assembly regulator SMI1
MNGKVILGIGLLIVMGALAVVVLMVPRAVRRYFYPPAPPMPPIVSRPMAEILGELEAVMKTNAPRVLEDLQAGLPNAEITALERQAGFQLPEDIRALYRWRNGSRSSDPRLAGPIPGHRFVPLAEALSLPAVISGQVAGATPVQRAAYGIFAGHRKSWITIFDDGCGDGYFFDPKRKASEGAVFYHLAEDMQYIFFPSAANLLAGAVKCYERKAFSWKDDPQGPGLEEDFNQSPKIWEEFGASNSK